MTPMPKLREKNACPVAYTMVLGPTLEKSGTKKNLRPSMALGENRPRTIRAIISKTKMGISKEVTFSMPFRTPPLTTNPVRHKKKMRYPIWRVGLAIKGPKASGSISPTRDLIRYTTVHPAMTP